MRQIANMFFTIVTTPLQIVWVLFFGLAMLLHPLYTLYILDRATDLLDRIVKERNANVT
jgi:hypothetical protein